MKSIFENICNNIQENGKLNPRFDINKYIEDEEILRFEPGALDGIARYHMQKKEDKRFKNYIIKILKRTDDKNIQEQAETITEYIIKNKKRAYPTIHAISSWVINNADSINFSVLLSIRKVDPLRLTEKVTFSYSCPSSKVNLLYSLLAQSFAVQDNV